MARHSERNNSHEASIQPPVRCAIYTRKSTDENMDNDFNSLDAQRESADLYIRSQAHAGWVALPTRYDDVAVSGATVERPALQRLLVDVEAGRIDTVVVYKIDRFSRSLIDFTKLIERLENHDTSLVSVTQQFNTTTSMGRLTLNILLSFAQFEREVIAERIRDKMGAAKKRGKWLGGPPPLGYDVDRDRKRLVENAEEAAIVRHIFRRYVVLRSTPQLVAELNEQGYRTKSWTTTKGKLRPGALWHKANISRLLRNPVYIGRVRHHDETYEGEHDGIIERALWDEVQALFAVDPQKRRGRSRSKTPALLKGMLRCGHCDAPMGVTFTTRSGKKYRYYLCQHANNHGYSGCPVKTVSARTVEQAVFDQLRAVFRSPEVVAETLRAAEARDAKERGKVEQKKEDLERDLALARAEAQRLMKIQADQDLAFVREELTRLDGERGRLEGELEKVTDELVALGDAPITGASIGEALGELDPIWENLFPAEQERIVRLLIAEVVVWPDRMDVILRSDGLGSITQDLEGESDVDELARQAG